jgi:hypothetical protein
LNKSGDSRTEFDEIRKSSFEELSNTDPSWLATGIDHLLGRQARYAKGIAL